MELGSLPDNPRIVILRQSAIGDVVHALPVLDALRRRFQESKIAWMVEPNTACLIARHRALTQALVVPYRWERSLRGIRGVRAALRQFEPDVVIDAQGTTKTGLASWLSGAPIRVGFARPNARGQSSRFYNVRIKPQREHVVDQNMELLGPFGHIPSPRFRIPLTESTVEIIDSGLRDSKLASSPFCVMNVGAAWSFKVWPPQRYGVVARFLGESFGVTSVVTWATAAEHHLAQQVIDSSAGHARLATATSLEEYAAIARRASFCLTGDTGPLHIAAAVGTPCIGLYAPTDPRRTGPYGQQHLVVQGTRPHYRNRRQQFADTHSMSTISVDQVLAACALMCERHVVNVSSTMASTSLVARA